MSPTFRRTSLPDPGVRYCPHGADRDIPGHAERRRGRGRRRVARSPFLCEGGHRYVVLREESVLRCRTAAPDAMRGQVCRLLAEMPLASVSLGIIPIAAQRTVWPLEAFYLHDDAQVVVEMLTVEMKVKQPRELADYARAFVGVAERAVYGDDARGLIGAAIDALG